MNNNTMIYKMVSVQVSSKFLRFMMFWSCLHKTIIPLALVGYEMTIRRILWEAKSLKSGTNWRLMIENTIAIVEIIDWWSRTTIAMVEIHDWWLRMTIDMVQNTIDDRENDPYGRTKRLVIENVDRCGWGYGDREYRPMGLRISIGHWELERTGDKWGSGEA